MQHGEQRRDAANSVDGELAAAYGAGLELAVELTAQLTSPAAVEGAVDLTFERRRESGALLWVVEYGGYLSCWSERSLQEAVGGLLLAHMEEDEQWSGCSLLEHGVNFNGYNYLTRETLSQAVIEYLTQQGWQFSQETLEDPESLMGGFGDDDQPSETTPTDKSNSGAVAAGKLETIVSSDKDVG
ncbi:hypothetical protein H6F86_30875 [Phormidium sp. FACHB-592]|uniref:Uncharacterized protein n=1 Tax=Stenomitos frigidus AS-A4 TaxID=2933935 RepID=A0ABV0KRR5_9CYAN|nr:hypothetical protein [Phormidium sp. FACHB-592]MBD2078217.1 hypothetical protein [Phormidium sp. FACHB-592]